MVGPEDEVFAILRRWSDPDQRRRDRAVWPPDDGSRTDGLAEGDSVVA